MKGTLHPASIGKTDWRLLLSLGCWMSQQHEDCALETDLFRQVYVLPHWEAQDHTCHLTQPKHTNTRPTSPRANPTIGCSRVTARVPVFQDSTPTSRERSPHLTASLTWWLRHSPGGWKIRGSNPTCTGIFLGRVIPVTSKLALQWLPCHAPGVKGSALGLVSPMSVYCDWVR